MEDFPFRLEPIVELAAEYATVSIEHFKGPLADFVEDFIHAFKPTL